MKAKNVLDKLKDLKLRRWGPAEYTRVKINGDSDSDDSGDGGESSDMTLADALIKTFDLNHNSYTFDDNNEKIKVETSLPLMVLCCNTKEGYIDGIGERVNEQIGTFNGYYDLNSTENIKVVPFEEVEYDDNYNTYLFLYDLNFNGYEQINHSYIYINNNFYIKPDGQTSEKWCYKYNDNYYVAYYYTE